MPRAIDHLVLATRDLDQTAELYRRMGFTVGARNRHAWGTLNQIVQFGGSFLELIALEPGFVAPAQCEPVWQFAGFLDRYLARRQGLAMLVLESLDGHADADRFDKAGIGAAAPFFFERQGKRADGTPVHVAFTLAFARTPAVTEAGFFVCQHHFPEAFWSPALQWHANGATHVSAVTLCANDPADLANFMEAFSGSTPGTVDGGLAFDCDRAGRIDILSPATVRASFGEATLPGSAPPPALIGFRIAVADLARAQACLEAAGLPFIKQAGRIVLMPGTSFGATVAFEAA